MEPTIRPGNAFKVIGIEFRIDIKTADYKKMWEQFAGAKDRLEPFSNGKGDYGLFHRAYDDGKVGYLLGTEVDAVSSVPDGFEPLEVAQALYAVFECDSGTIGETWPYIHDTWLPNSGDYEMTGSPVFEFYPPGYPSESDAIFIHIPVREKQ